MKILFLKIIVKKAVEAQLFSYNKYVSSQIKEL